MAVRNSQDEESASRPQGFALPFLLNFRVTLNKGLLITLLRVIREDLIFVSIE